MSLIDAAGNILSRPNQTFRRVGNWWSRNSSLFENGDFSSNSGNSFSPAFPCEENSIIWKRDWPLTWNICFRVVFLIQTSGFSGGDDGRTFSQVLSHIRGHDHPTLISTYIHKRCSSYLLMSKQSYISEKCQHWSWHQSQDDHSSETQVDEGLQEAPGDYYFQWSTFGCCEQNNNYQFKHNYY